MLFFTFNDLSRSRRDSLKRKKNKRQAIQGREQLGITEQVIGRAFARFHPVALLWLTAAVGNDNQLVPVPTYTFLSSFNQAIISFDILIIPQRLGHNFNRWKPTISPVPKNKSFNRYKKGVYKKHILKLKFSRVTKSYYINRYRKLQFRRLPKPLNCSMQLFTV